jgi:hypothetical protein
MCLLLSMVTRSLNAAAVVPAVPPATSGASEVFPGTILSLVQFVATPVVASLVLLYRVL